MERFGFVRLAVATPRVVVANVRANVEATLELADRAEAQGVDLLLFPELGLTGYSCADLFQQQVLLDSAAVEIVRLAHESGRRFSGLLVVGLPIRVLGRLYNVAAVVGAGRVLGVVPKQHIPNYQEFYERRWFVPAAGTEPDTVRIGDMLVPFGVDLVFRADDLPELSIGIELCEDLWAPIPPSCHLALGGATVVLNLSASNESTGKAEYRRDLVVGQSGRLVCAYAYAGAGVTESTTDLVFGGHAIISENGQLVAENQRFEREPGLLVADVDVERLTRDRSWLVTFAEQARQSRRPFRTVGFSLGPCRRTPTLHRPVPAHPFVPSDPGRLAERCHEIFATQTAGLAKRVEVVRPATLQIGVSGGLDSTLALLVAVKTCDLLGLERSSIDAVTMPGFGTSGRTLANARRLMDRLGVRAAELDIRRLCLDTFVNLGHRPFGIEPAGLSVEEFIAALAEVPTNRRDDLVFENVQARVRTLLLMSRGFVIGTGDLSEQALGWSTYNADHMSMYNPNASIPKTLVRFLVRWVADHEFTGELTTVLHSIADTEISPELLPIGAGESIQSTETAIGPYELHDFFLYHALRFGYRPAKVFFLACQAAFDGGHSRARIAQTLRTFYARFFGNQFKRSCMPDGPKVGTITLSPRGDWRMPSDADAALWLEDIRMVNSDL